MHPRRLHVLFVAAIALMIGAAVNAADGTYPSRPIRLDPRRDFAPVSQVGSVNFFLICNPAFPARSVQQMLDVIRAAPGKYNYASVGSGSPHHLFMEILKTDYALDLQHIPYKGTAAAYVDLLSGQVQASFPTAISSSGYIRAGRLRPLAVTVVKRVSALPNVPNIQAGKVVALGTSAAKPTSLLPSIAPIAAAVPGFDWQAWQGIVAPAGTPTAIIDRLWTELQKIQATAQFNEELSKFGMEPLARKTPAEFAATISGEQPRWAAVIRTSGAKVE